jgi:trehalose 6-phosphate phosphatase
VIPLTSAWNGLAARAAGAAAIGVGLDFDGTLTPIRDRPESVVLAPSAQAVLQRLASMAGVTVAIVSGRALADLERYLPLPGLLLIGNHGYEVRLPGGPPQRLYGESDRAAALEAATAAEAAVRGVPGVFLEDKGPIVALHYRLAPPSEIPRIADAVREAGRRFQAGVRVADGKCVYEFRPARPVDKARAFAASLAGAGVPSGAMLWFFGDDRSDEDVFSALPPDAVTVHVGDPSDRSAARYVVEAPGEVVFVLDALRQAAEKRPAAFPGPSRVGS